MRGIATQAAVLTISRLAGYGLMIISPIVLVRFLTVTDFGRYREFLLYASLLQTVAAFAISDSLLYFVPLYSASTSRVLRQTTILTAAISSAVVGAFIIVDLMVPGGLVGPYLLPVALYVLFYVNLDWWENFWVATRRPLPVFVYTAVRLIARLVVVVCAAVVTRDVWVIIWSLIVLEGLRLIGSFIAWKTADRSRVEANISGITRQQLNFCVPFGLATVIGLVCRNLGNIAVVKVLGAAALAQLAIGTYAEPIILALRNSISTVILPELVRRGGRAQAEALELWHRTVVVNCVLLFPTAIALAWYAEPLVVKAFGATYRPAIPVLQWYGLVIVRSCFDFSPLLRAVSKTRPFITAGVLAGLGIALLLALLLPHYGVVGAAMALAAASFIDAAYLGYIVKREYRCGWRKLIPWRTVAKVTLCAAAGAAIAFGVMSPAHGTFPGAVCGTILYGAVFVVLLLAARVDEVTTLLRRLRTMAPALRGR
jgi:O-antigen/teichoic acid export membrane protein